MKIKYDRELDILTISFSDEVVSESDEIKPGLIVDYGHEGRIIRLEMLDASKHSDAPFKVEYEVSVE